jgi:hypothetical protein
VIAPYGCGVNQEGSLTVLSGTAKLGGTLTPMGSEGMARTTGLEPATPGPEIAADGPQKGASEAESESSSPLARASR